jgi:hypothetical protein
MIFSFAGAVHAGLVKNLSTGINDATAQKLANNAPDTDYKMGTPTVSPYTGVVPITRSTPISANWVQDADSPDSSWIVLNTGNGPNGITAGPGSYTFETTFDMTGFDPATAKLSALRYTADDELLAILINGTAVFNHASDGNGQFFNWKNIAAGLGVGRFKIGTNAIDFVVLNEVGQVTPMGFRLEGSVQADPVPEPASFTLFAIAGGLLLGRRRRAI